jgi:hypothetical protein
MVDMRNDTKISDFVDIHKFILLYPQEVRH